MDRPARVQGGGRVQCRWRRRRWQQQQQQSRAEQSSDSTGRDSAGSTPPCVTPPSMGAAEHSGMPPREAAAAPAPVPDPVSEAPLPPPPLPKDEPDWEPPAEPKEASGSVTLARAAEVALVTLTQVASAPSGRVQRPVLPAPCTGRHTPWHWVPSARVGGGWLDVLLGGSVGGGQTPVKAEESHSSRKRF